MTPPDWTTVVGRLLTQAPLRVSLRRDLDACATRLGLSDDQRLRLHELDVDQLDFQAQTLVHKRYRGAAEHLPLSMRDLGERALPLFREFARHQWPTGHDRHAQDAVAFADFLTSRTEFRVDGGELALARLRLTRGRFALRWVRLRRGGRRRLALQLSIRRGSGVVAWYRLGS